MKKGFTLVEVLIVLVIVALVALIVIPVMIGILSRFREDSRRAQADQIYQAASTYFTENRNNINLSTFWANGIDALPNDLMYEDWEEELVEQDPPLRWGCIDTALLVDRGYLRNNAIQPIKEHHDLNDGAWVILVSRASGQPGVDPNRVRILDNFAITGNNPGGCLDLE